MNWITLALLLLNLALLLWLALKPARSDDAALAKLGADLGAEWRQRSEQLSREVRDEVAAMLADYAGTDLLCYRAEGPQPLIDRQAAGWDPLLDWAREQYDAPLVATSGVMFIAQPETSLAHLRAAVFAQDEFRLAALHDLIAITGSLVLGLAVAEGRLTADEAFALSRIDEQWQIDQWGPDEEAAALEATKHQALRDAARFYGLCR